MQKKRIMMVGESSHIKSGFGNYTREILSRLHATGKYEIAELSSYRTLSTPKTEPWRVYPVAVDPNHPLHSEYIANQNNYYGQWRFEFALLDFKPHIVFDVRDFWNYSFQEISPLRQFYHWIITPTYDSAPPKIDTINTFKSADTLLFHTEWAKHNLINAYNYNHSNLGPVASDAVDSNIFKPIGYSKKFHKVKFDIEPESFVIGSVMRNQKRKLIPDLIKIISNLIKKNTNKKIYLYLHTSYPDALGWDLPALLLEHQISNNVLISYYCKNCDALQCKVFKGVKTICNHCKKPTSFICHPTNAVDDSTLNNIYNLFDVYVQYAICEGFGIPPIEAASAGVPVVTINHEAMAEVGNNIGAHLVDTKRLFREQETNADRCLPNNDKCEEILQSLIELPIIELNNIGKNTRIKLLNTYSWDKTAQVYEQIFDSIDISKKTSWDIGPQEIDLHASIANIPSNRDFIYSIVDKVIKDPNLKKSNFIQELIKGLDDQIVQEGIKRVSFDRKTAVKILEIYANNKNAMEQMRLGTIPTSPKILDFIEYSKK
jgi:glycosyltransferase involved in cell wall biosynthesis